MTKNKVYYDPAELKKVQEYELSILKDFIKICEENNLTYFGIAGTGIGSLRHGGFIPWDDDIDVGILRNDFEKLVKIIKRDYADKYVVVNGDEFSTYPLMTTRITLKNSLFIEESLKKIKCPLGIFLDVYPFDNVPADEKLKRNQGFTAWLFSKLLILKHIPFPTLPLKGFKLKIAHFITACAWLFLNVFFIPHKWLYNKCKKACCKYNEDPNPAAFSFFCGTRIYNNYFETQDLFPLKKLKFEDVEINFPNNIEKSLTYIYGDYMKLPPEDKRKNHYPNTLKFPDEKV